nr:DUF2887 domain-containing protein [Alkalinema sp. FACHB-956]
MGEMEDLSLGVAAMMLTIVSDSEAPEKARMLINQVTQEEPGLPIKQVIIDIVITIITYRLTTLSRKEINVMLGTKLEETRVYKEAREDERNAIALNMLKDNLPVEQISWLTGLTIEQVQQLQSQAEQT